MLNQANYQYKSNWPNGRLNEWTNDIKGKWIIGEQIIERVNILVKTWVAYWVREINNCMKIASCLEGIEFVLID